MARFGYLVTSWFLAAWMLGSMGAFALGLDLPLGPMAAAVAVGIVVHRRGAPVGKAPITTRAPAELVANSR